MAWVLNVERSAKTPPPNSSSDIFTKEAIREAWDRGYDEVAKRVFAEPFDTEKYFRTKDVKHESGKVASLREWSGIIPVNRDADDIPALTHGEGFTWDWIVQDYRALIAVERKMLEDDEHGAADGRQAGLLRAFGRTVNFRLADVLNRAGFGVAGASVPVIADDGCTLIDDDRPNPNPEGGTWSNLEAASDFDEDAIYAAHLNAERQVSENGWLYPQEIKKIVLPVEQRQNAWKTLTKEGVMVRQYEDNSWAASMFDFSKDVEFAKYLTTSAVFYLLADAKSDENELYMVRRQNPTVKTEWGSMPNPDVMYSRLRARFGVALGSPRKYIRGGLLSSGS